MQRFVGPGIGWGRGGGAVVLSPAKVTRVIIDRQNFMVGLEHG